MEDRIIQFLININWFKKKLILKHIMEGGTIKMKIDGYSAWDNIIYKLCPNNNKKVIEEKDVWWFWIKDIYKFKIIIIKE